MTFTFIEVSFFVVLSYLLYEEWKDIKQSKAKKQIEIPS